MISITEHNKLIVYADDTTVLISGRTLTENKQHYNDIPNRFYNYFTLNKLSINPSKTKYIMYKPNYRSFKNQKKVQDTTCTGITMGGEPLKQVKSIKFSGVTINEKLAWDYHKKHVYSKICKNVGLIYKCRNIMDSSNS